MVVCHKYFAKVAKNLLINKVFSCLNATTFLKYSAQTQQVGKTHLVFQRISHRGYHSNLLYIRSIRVTIIYRELTLVSIHNLIDLALTILGKLLSCLLCIFDSLLHHFGLHLGKRHILIFHGIIITTIYNSYPFLQQITLTRNNIAHKRHFV